MSALSELKELLYSVIPADEWISRRDIALLLYRLNKRSSTDFSRIDVLVLEDMVERGLIELSADHRVKGLQAKRLYRRTKGTKDTELTEGAKKLEVLSKPSVLSAPPASDNFRPVEMKPRTSVFARPESKVKPTGVIGGQSTTKKTKED